MPRVYHIRTPQAVTALKGLHAWARQMAYAAVLVGGSTPQDVLAELRRVVDSLIREGWSTASRADLQRQPTPKAR